MALLLKNPNAEDLEAEAGLREIRAMYESLPHSLEAVRAAYIHVCEAFVGIHEVGTSNSSYWVDKFLKELGLGPGLSWCMALEQFKMKFVSSIWDLPDLLGFNHAGTQACWMHYEKLGFTTTDPAIVQPADQIVWRNGRTAHGHVGGVVSVVNAYAATTGIVIVTNEGNTSTDGTTPGRWRDGGACTNKTWNADQWGPWGKVRDPGRYTRGAIRMEMLYADALKRKAA